MQQSALEIIFVLSWASCMAGAIAACSFCDLRVLIIHKR
jgi:hypothetical protein